MTNSLEMWHIYVVTAIGSMANAFQQPAYAAAVTQLVPKRYLGHANGIVQLAGAAGPMLAPLLGGALVVLIGLPGIVVIDVVTCIVAVGTLVAVRFPDALFQRREEPFLKEIVGGWTYVLKRRGLLVMVSLFALTNLMQSIVIVLLTPLVLRLATPVVLGNVMAVNGIGMIVGSLVMSVWGGARRRVTGVLGFMALLGLSVVVMGLRPSPVYVAAGLFGAGAAIALANSHWLALIQTKVGLELQGRVIATDTMVSTSMQPLGFLLAGFLYEAAFAPLMAEGSPVANSLSWLVGTGPARGMGLLLVVVGVLSVGLAVGGYSYRRLRLVEDDLPDAVPDASFAADKDELQALADRQLMDPIPRA
jgi:MFS family permease